MTEFLATLVGKLVSVLTNDGKSIVGKLRGYDNSVNVILEDCEERIFDTEEGVEVIPLGLYIIRGDNLAVVGELDEEKDASIDWDSVKGTPLPPVTH